tara:strand:- start:108 stop:743 length:636 start_codon:yes stop_codon:yes gene_type:complete
MGASGARNGGASGSDAGFANTKKSKLTKANQEIVDSNFRDRGANKIKKGIKTPSIAVNVAGAILSKPLQAGSRVNRDFFTDKVLGSKNFKGTSKSDFMSMSVSQQESIYGDYMSGRASGKTDAYGNPIGGGNNNQSSMIKKNIGGKIISVTPTKAEVSQSEAVNAVNEEDPIYLRKKKTKAKGRSQTILTSSRGVTTDDELTLGKKSLLGS